MTRIAGIAALAALMAAVATHAAPLEAYGRLPSMEQVSISPDGTRIAFIRRAGEQRQLEVRAVPGFGLVANFGVNELKVRRVELVDDHHVMLITSSITAPFRFLGAKHEWARLQVYDIVKKKWMSIPDEGKIIRRKGIFERRNPLDEISGEVLVRRVNGHIVLFFRAYYPLGHLLPALMQADLESGDEELLHIASLDGKLLSLNWAVSAGGEVIGEQNYSEQNQHWSISVLRDGEWKVVTGGDASIDFPRLHGFGYSADTLLMRTRDNESAVWKLLSLTDGSFSDLNSEADSMSTPVKDRESGYMIGRSDLDDYKSLSFFEPSVQARWEATVKAFPDDHLSLISPSDGFKKAVVLIDGPNLGFQYRLVDLETRQSDYVGAVYDQVAAPLAVRRIDYLASDKLRIPAYLTLPRGRAATNLPLVVLVHGGPAERETAEFDWWSQALADQGYAVLRPNFRGSAISAKFLAAGFGEYGRKMQTDLSDGVRYLAEQGVVNPARVCIVGASYGGYAALAGVTLNTGVYKCAVSVAGPADLKELLKWVNGRHLARDNIEQRYWDRFMGISGPNDPVLEQISPIKHVESVNVPILLIHGKDDTVVPYEQSDDMYDALRYAKKNVEFVRLRYEDHWLSRSETRLQMLQATVAFLLKNNPPD